MEYKNVELHNAAELKEVDTGGITFCRAPDNVRSALNPGAQQRLQWPAGAEVRFVIEGPQCELTLSCLPLENRDRVNVMIFFGDYQYHQNYRIGSEPETIKVVPDERLQAADLKFIKNKPFDRRVCRVWFSGGRVCLHDIKGKVRPPRKEELPDKRLLMYGTSITQGAAATNPHLTYASVTARFLGMDLINLGCGGSALCENEIADYIASRKDWNVGVLALSVNMRGFELDEFYSRVSYMVNTVAGAKPARPVACITLWPYYDDMTTDGESWDHNGKTSEQFRQKLRDAVKACPHPNVHLLEGPEMMKDTSGLTGDLIHPGDFSMIEMGQNLAKELKAII